MAQKIGPRELRAMPGERDKLRSTSRKDWDKDDAPRITKAMLDRAEVRDGDKIVRRGRTDKKP